MTLINQRALAERIHIDFSNEKQMTKQSQTQESDIHYILRNFTKTGEFTHINKAKPTYGDFSNAEGYFAAQLQIREAQEDFANLPSAIRDRFNNDPGEVLDFLEDETNAEEAMSLGLLAFTPDPEQPDPDPADSAPPPAEGGDPPTPPS